MLYRCAIVVVFLLLACRSFAQEVSAIRIFTEPSGVEYFVDGERFLQPTSFLWPKGSKHVVHLPKAVVNHPGVNGCGQAESTPLQYDANCSARYGFSGWETNVGVVAETTTHIVTADPSITFLKGNFTAEYRVNIATPAPVGLNPPDACTYAPLGPRPPGAGFGLVFIGDVCVDYATSLWLEAGEYAIQALPFDGYIFDGWSLDNGVTTGYVNVINVTGPMTIQPMFGPAKRVRLYTEPYGLQLRVDRTIVNTVDPNLLVPKYPIPGYYDWAANSTHLLAGVSPQVGQDGNTWVFDSWSNGGGQDMEYNVGGEVNAITELTAKFVRGVPGSIMTMPAGLKVQVDDSDNVPYTFAWKVGSKVRLSAPAEQTDSRGRKFIFKEWSNGGPATQEIAIGESQLQTGVRLIALYEAMPQAVIQTSVPGAAVKVDGADCTSPCKLDRPLGTKVRVVVPAQLPVSDSVRHDFIGWQDGGSAERTVIFDRDTQTIGANYRKANRLIVLLDPANTEAAAVITEPSSSDGFYWADTSVRVTVEAKSGFRFRRWDGDLSGTSNSGVVNMNASRVVRARFDRVPFVGKYSVINAAGATPEPGVAPGSLISIFGASLANRFEASPSGRLLQTLAGAVVMVEDRILPLVYVAPEQINAQLPGDLTPGNYTLRVMPEGQVEVKAEFTIVRNAPGLFANTVNSVPYAVVLHENGSAVTMQNPARRDETVTLLGTGFGPYDRRIVDGFAVAAGPAISLTDPVEVSIGGILLRPEWSGAMPGYSGVSATRIKLAGLPGGPAELKVAVHGVESNTVVLPLE